MDPSDKCGIYVLNLQSKAWETFERMNGVAKLVEVEKKETLSQKVIKYLDQCGVLTEQIEKDIQAMIESDE